MPPKRKTAEAKEKRPAKMRPAKSKSTRADGAAQFSLQQEMLQVLQRVSSNKSKRTATTLVDEGPVRAFVVALDKGAELEQEAIDGNATVQCLIGEVEVKVGRGKKRMHVGDLLVLAAGSAHGLEAIDPSALLITIAIGGGE